MRMVWIRRFAANQMVNGHPVTGDAHGLQLSVVYSGQHVFVSSGFIQVRVFTFDIQENDRHVGCLGLLNESTDSRGFPAASGSQHCGVSWKTQLLVRRHAHWNIFIPDNRSKADVPVSLENPS